MEKTNLTLLYAFEGFEKDLSEELSLRRARVLERQGRLFVVEDLSSRPAWAQVHGAHAIKASPKSITESAKFLRNLGGKWACASQTLHRRSQLIQEQASRTRPVPEIEFLGKVPAGHWGIWALLNESTLIASAETDSVFPLGEVKIKESEEPPSRAYMKLWELFTLYGIKPSSGARTIDLGSSPGGWTWVLAELGCKVVAVDKAPLAPNLAKNPSVKSLKKDAFKLSPAEVGAIDWLFSDLICYPPKLFDLVQIWREAGVKNFVCTLKFQGLSDFESMARFLEIPGSWIVHLCANKHEVTWVCLEKGKN
ncbi:MAG TPA: SAM-dependent methyltransferase [Pseudobdellovibrionaceae bacterium]|nr:SAM-dependent methyltransferase [Pseudobdellovibrionaceae bacterium]